LELSGDQVSIVITVSTLASHLWEATNILCGSLVDRTDWNSYILPLLFFKRICDMWEEEYQEAVETYGEDFAFFALSVIVSE
jgi:type I restriction enzyme M protein